MKLLQIVRKFEDITKGIVTREYQLPSGYFGEGIAVLNGRMYILENHFLK